jgi:DNA (cytosine-5)-methyltransferase 1
MKSIGLKPKMSRRLVEFGDAELLNMDMSKAARAFDVGKPNTKRDQKSGVKKRKQYDIERGRLAAIEATGG